jgi:hypothetical protein
VAGLIAVEELAGAAGSGDVFEGDGLADVFGEIRVVGVDGAFEAGEGEVEEAGLDAGEAGEFEPGAASCRSTSRSGGRFAVPALDRRGQCPEQRSAVASIRAPVLTGERRRTEGRQAL